MVKVSVIIPTYGGGKHLKCSIHSVLSQDYSEMEIIVVDDNGKGTKNQITTKGIIECYLSLKYFKYIVHVTNKNGSAARNSGAEIAKGKYLIFLDDDDTFSPGKIKYQVEQLENLGPEWAGSYSSRITKVNGKIANKTKARVSGSFLYRYMMNAITVGTGSLLIRRDIWQELKGFDESFKRYQDREFVARVLDKYKLAAAGKVSFERNYLGRFTPKTPEETEKLMDHFMKRMRDRISSLSYRELKRIENYNYMGIALKYLKYRKFKRFFNIIQKQGNVFLSFYYISIIAFKYFFGKTT